MNLTRYVVRISGDYQCVAKPDPSGPYVLATDAAALVAKLEGERDSHAATRDMQWGQIQELRQQNATLRARVSELTTELETKCAGHAAQLEVVTRERDEALRKLEEATKPHASWAHIENPKVHERIPQPGDSDHHYSYEGEHQ